VLAGSSFGRRLLRSPLGVPTWVGAFYLLTSVGGAVAAYFTTFRYTYFANANTRLHGWPIPRVIFQRGGPSEPWLDLIGPTIVLAYPINFVLFAITPAIVVLVAYVFTNRSPSLSAKK
jgi:hypothetical protein